MMNKVERLTLQQQIESLTIVLEHWLPVLEQMELIKSNLENLPTELEKIQQNLNTQKRKQAKSKNEELSGTISVNKDANNQKILYSKLKNILGSLEAETPRLILLGENIDDLVCLREIIEALQERIEIQSNNDYGAEFQSIKGKEQKEEQNNIFRYISHSWQNLRNQTKVNHKIKLTLVFGLLLSWNLLSNFIYTQTVNKNVDNQVTNMKNRLEKLESDRLLDSIEKQ